MTDFLRTLVQYAISGGIAAVIDVGAFVLLIDAGVHAAMAACASFGIAALVNYGLSSRFVFMQKATLRGFALFLAGALVGLSINLGVTLACLFVLGFSPLAAKITGVGLAFLANFLINRSIVFRRRS